MYEGEDAATQNYQNSPNDLLIIRMKENGKIMGGYNINFYDGDVDIKIGDNSLFIHENYYIFGGQSYGFNTKQRNVTYDVDNPVFNSFVFKYDYQKDSYNENCFYQNELSRAQLEVTESDLGLDGDGYNIIDQKAANG